LYALNDKQIDKIMEDLRELRENGIRIYDETTNNYIFIEISNYYLTLGINDRSYYFNKDNGEYDGHSEDISEELEQPFNINELLGNIEDSVEEIKKLITGEQK
jgi:hypothetical protein